ncbi:15221_t:CDS:2, partial [Racocetra fulgida]
MPPEDYINYLTKPEVMSAIGAKTPYVECSDVAYLAFTNTADLQKLQNFIVNGQTTGQVQSSPYLSFVNIYQAGHEAPFYQPQTSLVMYTR